MLTYLETTKTFLRREMSLFTGSTFERIQEELTAHDFSAISVVLSTCIWVRFTWGTRFEPMQTRRGLPNIWLKRRLFRTCSLCSPASSADLCVSEHRPRYGGYSWRTNPRQSQRGRLKAYFSDLAAQNYYRPLCRGTQNQRLYLALARPASPGHARSESEIGSRRRRPRVSNPDYP